MPKSILAPNILKIKPSLISKSRYLGYLHIKNNLYG